MTSSSQLEQGDDLTQATLGTCYRGSRGMRASESAFTSTPSVTVMRLNWSRRGRRLAPSATFLGTAALQRPIPTFVAPALRLRSPSRVNGRGSRGCGETCEGSSSFAGAFWTLRPRWRSVSTASGSGGEAMCHPQIAMTSSAANTFRDAASAVYTSQRLPGESTHPQSLVLAR